VTTIALAIVGRAKLYKEQYRKEAINKGPKQRQKIKQRG